MAATRDASDDEQGRVQRTQERQALRPRAQDDFRRRRLTDRRRLGTVGIDVGGKRDRYGDVVVGVEQDLMR